VMMVPDTLLDARFADNPLVSGEPRIRFYAGHPLVLHDDVRVGTLCLVDTRPRWLDESKLGLLRDLGHMVEQELRASARPEATWPTAG
jgi:GAF domain-containing protein